MLYGLLMFLVALTAGVLGFGAVSYGEPYLRARWGSASFVRTWFRRIWFTRIHDAALAAARRIRRIRLDRLSWDSGVVYSLICLTVITAALVAVGFRHVYFDRTDLPDMEAFARFEFPTIGHVYDVNGRSLIELAREYRQITEYKDIPPIVRDAILAAEDKNFFSHGGVDYFG
ncbi:MAG TPA: transglycosylase domain-containing protein, partial [Candidatus Binatia bacterium]